jgi:hypothetical protein
MFSFSDYDDCNHALDNGYIHEDDLPDIESAREFLVGIQECVYQTGDVGKLEYQLEELCAILDCKLLPTKDDKPKIRKSNDLMEWYIDYQRATMDQNMNNGRTLKENHNV